MTDLSPADIARAWVEAYREFRDDELLAMAHPDVALYPRRGQGLREYHGLDGVRAWLADVGTERPELEVTAAETLADGRALTETTIDGVGVIAVFELRDGLVASVRVYLSDRAMLQQLGLIREASQ